MKTIGCNFCQLSFLSSTLPRVFNLALQEHPSFSALAESVFYARPVPHFLRRRFQSRHAAERKTRHRESVTLDSEHFWNQTPKWCLRYDRKAKKWRRSQEQWAKDDGPVGKKCGDELPRFSIDWKEAVLICRKQHLRTQGSFWDKNGNCGFVHRSLWLFQMPLSTRSSGTTQMLKIKTE